LRHALSVNLQDFTSFLAPGSPKYLGHRAICPLDNYAALHFDTCKQAALDFDLDLNDHNSRLRPSTFDLDLDTRPFQSMTRYSTRQIRWADRSRSCSTTAPYSPSDNRFSPSHQTRMKFGVLGHLLHRVFSLVRSATWRLSIGFPSRSRTDHELWGTKKRENNSSNKKKETKYG
jgi:hypothetical protein